MNRKNFLQAAAVLAAAAGIPSTGRASGGTTDTKPVRIPPYLKKGDLIGITSPAGYIKTEDIQSALAGLKEWGYETRVGETVGKRDYSFGGTDEERLADFQRMLDDPSVKAILCARGGYGAVRIIDRLNWKAFRRHPKWIIGFSDITVLHSHLNRVLDVASIHSKMCGGFPEDWSTAEPVQIDTILSLKKAIEGEQMKYEFAAAEGNKPGIAEGVLVGGNLRTLETLTGSASDIHTRGKILFVEDVGEYLYSIDRMFWNLERSGKLTGLKGLVVGGFRVKPPSDPEEEFGRTIQQIVLEKTGKYKFPVCFDFPVGHQKNNFALKCGVRHRLEVKDGLCSLTEIR